MSLSSTVGRAGLAAAVLVTALAGSAPALRSADSDQPAPRAASTRSVSVPVEGTGTTGAASRDQQGVLMPDTGSGSAQWSVVLPADYVRGSTITVDVLYDERSDSACSWFASASGVLRQGDRFVNGGWYLPRSTSFDGPISVPAGSGNFLRARFTSPYGDQLRPGDPIQFLLNRNADQASDNCDSLFVRGILLRY